MTKNERMKAILDLNKWVKKYTKCDIQDGWACGTCFYQLLSELIDQKAKDYQKHNKSKDI